MIVLPRPAVEEAIASQLPVSLIPSRIGYFPNAVNHYCEHATGCGRLVLILCVRGRGWVDWKGGVEEVGPGQLLAILPKEPHRFGAAADRPWTIYWCHAAGRVAERVGAVLRPESTSPRLEAGDQPRLIGLFDEIMAELGKGFGVDHLLPASMALAHLIGVLTTMRRSAPAPSNAILRVESVIRYMEARQREQIRVPEIASTFNLSTSHFCAVFKRATGHSPLDYFIRMKLRLACEMLDGTRLPVKQVAEELGFADALYFSRTFHKVHGMSPTEYRSGAKVH
jgi:AraC family transcriptional regulator, arabinose operon regulatory protein